MFHAPPHLEKTPFGKDAGTNAQSAEAGRRVLRVGSAEEFRTIAEAARSAKDNDIVEIQSGEYHGDVALWTQKRLSIKTSGGNVRIFADGKSSEGKAIWVIRNGDFDIQNIDFIGAHVSDNNGSGIRFENGRLHVKNCLFYGNDTGLLTGNSGGTLIIENSEFSYNGFGDGYSHNIYVGRIDSFKVSGSYFHHANIGHLIKSRARSNYIYYNRLTDESGGRASYELDLPNGGLVYVVGNIIQQGPGTRNSTMIAYGAEGLHWPVNMLFLASNTIVNDNPYGGIYLFTAPGTQQLLSVNNMIIGSGKYHSGDGPNVSFNNVRAGWEVFMQASRHDYRLNENGRKQSFVTPDMPDLVPKNEYKAQRSIKKLISQPMFPGALQTQ